MANDGRSKIFTGARARFKVNGKWVGWASGVDVSEEITQEAVDVLDQYEPYEYAPTAYRVTCSARYFRIPRESLTKHELFTESSTNSDTLRRNILNQLELEATILDVHTNTPIGKLSRVKPSVRNLSVGARSLAGENVQFTAIYHKDEG